MTRITIKTDKPISENDFAFILNEIKKEKKEIESIKIESIHSFGLLSAEHIFSIVIIPFVTAIAANLAYDCGKLIVKSLKKRNIKVEIQENEQPSKNKKKSNKKIGSIKYPLSGSNPALGLLPDSFWQNAQLDVNRAKGKGYEKLAKALVVDSLKEKLDTSKLTILIDKKWFYCFADNNCRRRYDIFIKELLVGYEIKSSRVVYNRFVREQIQKDKWLLEQNEVNEVRWILFNGATGNVLQALTHNKIMYLDITGNENSFTNIPQIYHEYDGKIYTSLESTVIPL